MALADISAAFFGYVPPSQAYPKAEASALKGLGDKDAALDWLKKADGEHDAQIFWRRVTPACDPLRGEPRFQRLVAGLSNPPPAR
jgi:hypothetical protein